MARGYGAEQVRGRLIGILGSSKTGMSGVEISEKLGINRVTMAKYLGVFAAGGLIGQRRVGNITLWYMEETEQFRFPDDYFQVCKKYQDLLMGCEEGRARSLVRNCLHSGATPGKMITEVIMPAALHVAKSYMDGRVGDAERGLLHHIMYGCVMLVGSGSGQADPRKNAILVAADPASVLLCEAASAALGRDGWSVFTLGDMSASVDVMFDLDLQKFLGKVWKKRPGMMVIAVFSETGEGLGFFAGAANTARGKIGGDVRIVLCSRAASGVSSKADLVEDDLGAVLQWMQTVHEG